MRDPITQAVIDAALRMAAKGEVTQKDAEELASLAIDFNTKPKQEPLPVAIALPEKKPKP